MSDADRVGPRNEMTCREIIDLVTAFLEGVLPERERARFADHIAGCEGCRRAVEQFRTTVRVVGRLSEDELSPQMRTALIGAFRDWRRSAG